MTVSLARRGGLREDLTRDGWALVRGVASPETVARIKAWLRNASTISSATPRLEAQFEDESDAPCSRTARKLRRLFWNDPGFWRDVLTETGMAGYALDTLGDEAILTFHAAFLKAAGGGSAVPFHQDQALWTHDYPGALNMWLAVHPTTVENGCIELCPRSHRRGALPHARHDPSWVHDGIDIAAHGLSPCPIEMEAGDLLLWDRFTVHGSAVNRSGRDRWGVVSVFVDGSPEDFRATDHVRVRDMHA